MHNRIACAPCCWGIEEPDNGLNPSWGKVLMEASDCGYRGIELGPDGYFPEEAMLTKSACRTRGLEICAGKLQQPFSDGEQMPAILNQTEKTCVRLKALGVGTLLLMEGNHPERFGSLGQSATAPRLTSEQKHHLINNMRQIISLAQDHGLRCLLHPGVGGYIGFKDEIEFVLHQISDSELGLCLDIGHTFLDGMDPLSLIRRYADRIEHVHLKDVSIDKLRVAIRDKQPWFDAYSDGLVTPLGDGDIKLNQVIASLKSIDYQGWLVVEHEHNVKQSQQVKVDLQRSRNYLASLGV
ncbi:sugar phosphate isomerase/epimerase family protein [Vibrio barjaei]|uniref:sugar phosphate isomerase/epimerase family protein n=1 Tax=Vibrio barjaei TaxID=1676683 RepID=UPI0007BBD314|nr:TIM barrel protein [Vibrio barjaei]MCY9873189.1 TIM barrel protein [Vibrio barjaei]OIN27920.1 myo-inositol catabolism protein [Vibrio barjaei]